MSKPPSVLMLMLSLVLMTGCANSDWTQNTLVTADVTGMWVGSFGVGNAVSDVRLELEQQGMFADTIRRFSVGQALNQQVRQT